VGPRAGLDDMEKRKFLTLQGLEPRPLRRSARSQSLYRLCYLSGAHKLRHNIINTIQPARITLLFVTQSLLYFTVSPQPIKVSI
jgi:hypothetical protein